MWTMAGINDFFIRVFFRHHADTPVGGLNGTDGLYLYIWWVSVFFFVLLMAIMVYCMVKYRRRPGKPAPRSPSHHTALEITWTVIPTLLLTVMFFWGFSAYLKIVISPPDAEQIDVTASKWSWAMEYPNGKTTTEFVTMGTNDNAPVFYVPAATPVQLRMTSTDVLHAFWVPDFRYKFDVVPNRYVPFSFTTLPLDHTGADPEVKSFIDKDGTEVFYKDHWLFCAEYCGDQHSEMQAIIRVVDPAYYRQWRDTPSYDETTPPIDVGKLVWSGKGCATCHSVDGSAGTGPTWLNAWGSPHTFTNADPMTQADIDADSLLWDNYIRESILVPGAKIREGFTNQMPSYDGRLTPVEIRGVIAYMRSLSDKNDGQEIQGFDELNSDGAEGEGGP